jgi:hypothetical protein
MSASSILKSVESAIFELKSPVEWMGLMWWETGEIDGWLGLEWLSGDRRRWTLTWSLREELLSKDLIGGPDNNSGSSVGLGGGIGWLRSISGGSALIVTLRSLFNPTFLLLMDMLVGVNTTSFGDENFTAGGSYGGIGVMLLLCTAEMCLRA